MPFVTPEKPNFDPVLLSKINSTPVLLSLLYDVNLMPEQISTPQDFKSLQAVVIAYDLGRAAVEDR